nr:hypothetical protein CFP56_19276 [Quercus suber]
MSKSAMSVEQCSNIREDANVMKWVGRAMAEMKSRIPSESLDYRTTHFKVKAFFWMIVATLDSSIRNSKSIARLVHFARNSLHSCVVTQNEQLTCTFHPRGRQVMPGIAATLPFNDTVGDTIPPDTPHVSITVGCICADF